MGRQILEVMIMMVIDSDSNWTKKRRRPHEVKGVAETDTVLMSNSEQ